jgi:hypothetical protein
MEIVYYYLLRYKCLKFTSLIMTIISDKFAVYSIHLYNDDCIKTCEYIDIISVFILKGDKP